MSREVEFHARQLQLRLEEDALAELRQVHGRWRLGRGAGLLRQRLRGGEIFDLHAKMVQAVAARVGIRRFPRALPTDDRQVDVAVGQVHLAGEIAVSPADFLQPESLFEQLRGREGVKAFWVYRRA